MFHLADLLAHDDVAATGDLVLHDQIRVTAQLALDSRLDVEAIVVGRVLDESEGLREADHEGEEGESEARHGRGWFFFEPTNLVEVGEGARGETRVGEVGSEDERQGACRDQVKNKIKKNECGKEKVLDYGFNMSPDPERVEGEVFLGVLLRLAQRVELFQQSLLEIELGGGLNQNPRGRSKETIPRQEGARRGEQKPRPTW